MRQQDRYNDFLRVLGLLTKVLLVAMFMFTVSCILVTVLGGFEPAWLAYRFIWPFFWKSGFTLLCTLAIAIALDALQ